METRFTPGPWKWDESYGAVMAASPAITKLVCPMWTGLDRKGLGRDVLQEDEANARLISAAPDLYAILARICKDATECECHGEPSTVDGIQWEDIVEARAALAKARGDSTGT